MEWHGEKMLPRGLPELIHQVTPHWIARDLKVIACHRDPFDPKNREALGSVGWHDHWWVLRLFPTKILRWSSRLGVMSFSYWLKFLEVVLHEVGHIVTADKLVWKHYHRRYEEDYLYHRYVEGWADWWMDMTKSTIARRDPRLGQPLGWIGGLPGLYLIRQGKTAIKSRSDNNTRGSLCYPGIQNVGAYRCGGQLTLTDVLSDLAARYLNTSYYSVPRFMRRLRAYVKRAAPKLGITRHYIDMAGRKHLFFNNGEAKAMVDHLREYVSKSNLIEVMVMESMGYDRVLQASRDRLFRGVEISPPQPLVEDIPF